MPIDVAEMAALTVVRLVAVVVEMLVVRAIVSAAVAAVSPGRATAHQRARPVRAGALADLT